VIPCFRVVRYLECWGKNKYWPALHIDVHQAMLMDDQDDRVDRFASKL
jgi:hypothetical protein